MSLKASSSVDQELAQWRIPHIDFRQIGTGWREGFPAFLWSWVHLDKLGNLEKVEYTLGNWTRNDFSNYIDVERRGKVSHFLSGRSEGGRARAPASSYFTTNPLLHISSIPSHRKGKISLAT